MLACGLQTVARGAQVEGLYAATVPLADGSAESLKAAYAEALRRVLAKVTGRRDSGARLAGQFADPQRIVQQYRRDAAGTLWVQFDQVAIRRGLDAAGEPVWADERPTTLVWLAFDTGAGHRDILGSEAAARSGNPAARADIATELRQELVRAGTDRGVPLVLPLRDSQDLAAVQFADVWGDFSDRVLQASRRYQPDAVLVGRARLFPAGMQDVRWTLHQGNERLEWRGTVADGPAGLAERLAERLATAGAADQDVLLAVTGVSSFDGYGQVLEYLRGIDLVESLDVPFVTDDVLICRLRVRGGPVQLTQALALGRLLEPEDAVPAIDIPGAARMPDLAYRLAGRR
jgi:hypothetical protein